jgi:hypothetical protein
MAVNNPKRYRLSAANYDPGIVDYLDAPIGSAYGRNERGEFTAEDMPDIPDE